MPGYNVPPRRTLKDYLLPVAILLALAAAVVLAFRLWGITKTDDGLNVTAGNLTATVTAPAGAADVFLPATGAWKILDGTTTLGTEERVRTGVNGTAELTLSGGTRVVLAGNTELEVGGLSSGLLNKTAELTLRRGRVWLDATGALRETAVVKTTILRVSAPTSALQLAFDPAKNNEVTVSVARGAAAAEVWDSQENQKMTTLPVEEGQTLTLTDRRINLLRIGGEIELVKPTPAPVLAEVFYAAQAAKSGATATASTSATGETATTATPPVTTEDVNAPAATTETAATETTPPAAATTPGLLAAPGITTPVGGQLTTTATSIKIAGTAPATATKIEVSHNGGAPYTLGSYRAGSTVWSYNAAVKYGNLLPGTNRYTVVASDAAGNRSQPAVVTVDYSTTAPETATPPSTTASPAVEPATPASPATPAGSGTFGAPTVATPAAGATLTTAPVRLSGSVPAGTTAVEVNGYRLTKGFTAGGSSWYYNAAPEYGNLAAGTNTFTITAIGPNGEKGSTAVTFTYQPAASAAPTSALGQ